MSQLVLPALFALFVWWFSTGLVIYLDGRHPRTFKWTNLGATVLLVASLGGLWVSAGDASALGAYCSFACAMLAWAWLEVTFYTGWVTGPRPDAAPEGSRGWGRFGFALLCSLWHEIAALALAALVVWLTRGQPNQIGTWTFMVMWWMHESARVNVFLGVANLNEEFLPDHMRFLSSYMTKKPMNLLFPVSVSVSTAAATLLLYRGLSAEVGGFDAAGYTFLGAMMSIAVLEHWFLVTPLPIAGLWEWGLKSRDHSRRFDLEQLKLAEIELSTRLIERRRT